MLYLPILKKISIKKLAYKNDRFTDKQRCILYVIFFCVAFSNATATICLDNNVDETSFQIIEQFNYCWGNNTVRVGSENLNDTALVAFHQYIISPIFRAFAQNENKRTEVNNVEYCCVHYQLEIKNDSLKYLVELNLLSDITCYSPVATQSEKLKENGYMIVDIISEAPVACLVFVEDDCLIAITYNMFYNLNEVLSISKSFIKRHQKRACHNTNDAKTITT